MAASKPARNTSRKAAGGSPEPDAEPKPHAVTADQPADHIAIHFTDPDHLAHVKKPLGEDVSSIALVGRTLFCAGDESATVERLIFDPAAREFADHTNIVLADLFDLPGGADGEMDIEGLAVSDGYLWITGSHGLKRDSPDDADPAVDDLDDIDWDRNRGFLGRIPLIEGGDGVFETVAALEPAADGKELRRAAMMKMGRKGKKGIRRLLGKHPLFRPFMKVPSKENGFDVEGLAADGDRIFLGLRGPVIGSYAILVDMVLRETEKGWLKARKLDGGSRFRLHAVDLHGLGIRDMLIADGRLFILAGATQNIEGIQRVFAIDIPPETTSIFPSNEVQIIRTLEILDGVDHAEGICALEHEGKRHLLVAHDSPAPDRYDPQHHRLLLDVFPFD